MYTKITFTLDLIKKKMIKHSLYTLVFLSLLFSCKGQDKKIEDYNFELEDSDQHYIMNDWSTSKIEQYYKRIAQLITDIHDDYKIPSKTHFSDVINSSLNLKVDYNKTFQIAPKTILGDYEMEIIIFPNNRIIALSNELPLLDSVSVKHYRSNDFKNLDHTTDNNLILNEVFFKNNFDFNKASSIIDLLKKNNIQLYGPAFFAKTHDLNMDGIQDSIIALKNKLYNDTINHYESKIILKKGSHDGYMQWKENTNLIFKAPENCFSEGFQNIVFKNEYFTIEQTFCNKYLVYAYTTFKFNKKNNELYLHKYGEEYIQDDNSPVKETKIWTKKDFGEIKINDINKDFFIQLRQNNPK